MSTEPSKEATKRLIGITVVGNAIDDVERVIQSAITAACAYNAIKKQWEGKP